MASQIQSTSCYYIPKETSLFFMEANVDYVKTFGDFTAFRIV